MPTAQRTIIVPAAAVETYRALAATWPGGVGMFRTPCYTNAELTHYISSGKIDAQVAALLDDVPAFAQVTGTSVEQAQALRDGMQMGLPQETAHDTLARLGLTLGGADDVQP